MDSDTRSILARLADGEHVPAVFGPGRVTARDRLAATLRGMRPSEDERIAAAFGYGNARRIRAYDAGIAYLREAYNTILVD